MPRVAELDAVRALAALAILLFHLDPPRFYPGWSGVDLFFVLSGYLITAIILKDGHTERFLPRFYARRTLRIWPIYYLTLLAVMAANAASARPLAAGGWPRYATYTQNVALLWRRPDPPFPPAFDHAWTLALEEQFYLIWPALVLRAGRRRLAPLALFAAALAVAMRTGGYLASAPFSERLLPSRCDGFALGGLLAAALPRPGSAGPATRAALATTAAASSAYLVAGARAGGAGFIGLPTPAAPGATIFAFVALYAGLIGLAVAHAGAPALAPLRAAWLGYLGRISYGVYLYHYPIYWYFDLTWPSRDRPWSSGAAKILLSVAVAAASWHLIERPILGLKCHFDYRPVPEPAPPDDA